MGAYTGEDKYYAWLFFINLWNSIYNHNLRFSETSYGGTLQRIDRNLSKKDFSFGGDWGL